MNDQQAAEYMAGVESAMQTARWSIPVDLAINAHADALAFDGAPFPDLEISGDHRPRSAAGASTSTTSRRSTPSAD